MTKYLSCGLILALLLFLKTPSKADSIPEIVAKTKPAIVETVTTDATGAPKALGTGFFISPNGLVVTNQHGIQGADSITFVSNNVAIFLFERVIAQPAGLDLVVLKFHAPDVPFLRLGKSTTAVEGQKVIVIGNPTGLMGTVSDGILSAFREDRSMIQITAPISHWASGSPVMDETGQVFGIATLERAEGQNLNFAIPVEKVLSAPLMESPSEQVASSALPTPAIDAKAPFGSGNAFFDKKEYDKAISAFTEAIRLDPNNALAHCNRGRAYVNKGDNDKAIRDFDEAIRLDPRLAPAYNGRGVAYDSQGKFDQAVNDYSDAIRLDPNLAKAYYNRGIAYSNQGNLDKAISDYNEAIRLDPNSADAFINRGNAYSKQGKFDQAVSDYDDAIRLDSNYARAYNNRGIAYGKQGKYAKAISDFTEAIRLDPNLVPAYNNRGTAYAEQGNLDKADADFATAKRLKAGQ